MIRFDFQDKSLPMLGFGCMRLPLIPDGKAGDIDEAETRKMISLAMENGCNYFDTAYPYHDGESERVVGKILSEYPRESFFLADKFPGHQIQENYDAAEVFEDQLKKCGVEYFDFYLLHNVYENSIHTYFDPRWKIVEYFIEQKRQGRIRHLGFSTHGSLDIMKSFLDRYGNDMEFCQIQLNYLDWTLQNGAAKVKLLNERNIPIWVMEPLRGGKLVRLKDEEKKILTEKDANASPIETAFRFLQDVEGVGVILSGMSSLSQLKENLGYFRVKKPLLPEEKSTLFSVAEKIKNAVPCTACRYCVKDCPMGLDIPLHISVFNELSVVKTFNTSMRIECLPEEKKPSACISCGLCAKNCPQLIDIPDVMKKLSAILKDIPSWKKISREREEIAKKMRENK